MKKALAKGLLVIIEAGIDVLAEKIRKRMKKNGNSNGLDFHRGRRGAYDLRNRSAAHSGAVADRCTDIRPHTHWRSISKEGQKT